MPLVNFGAGTYIFRARCFWRKSNRLCARFSAWRAVIGLGTVCACAGAGALLLGAPPLLLPDTCGACWRQGRCVRRKSRCTAGLAVLTSVSSLKLFSADHVDEPHAAGGGVDISDCYNFQAKGKSVV